MNPELREPAPEGRPVDDQAAAKLLVASTIPPTGDGAQEAAQLSRPELAIALKYGLNIGHGSEPFLRNDKRGTSPPPTGRSAGDVVALRQLLHQIDIDEHMRRRAVQQAILHAEAWYWRMRAEQFDWARPRSNDFNGRATPEMLAEADRRCRETRDLCLSKADLIEYEAGGDLDV
jgi:hypothetical protein